jgi:transketolase C-terminal domain/subunit
MAGKAGRSGRKMFVPTEPQRNAVKIMAALGMPQEQIRIAVLNPENGKPIDAGTLAKHFKQELASGMLELHALVGGFMVATMLG